MRPNPSANPETLFDRPVIILAAPRSGSTLLFETLAKATEVWTIGGESHQIIEGLVELSPGSGRVNSNRLTAGDATEQTINAIQKDFTRRLRDRQGRRWSESLGIKRLRFLEKTPKNALRQPFLDKIFPGAYYIYLYRDPRENISSMMDAWESGRWVTYPGLENWSGLPWSLLLPPGWERLSGCPLEQVCAFQWEAANRIILDDLSGLPPQRWTAIDYGSLTQTSDAAVRRLCAYLEISVDEKLSAKLAKPLPLARFTLSRPKPEKWRKNEAAIHSVLDSVQATDKRAKEVLGLCRDSGHAVENATQ
ncbi:MAG: hypothetical protein BMS9Abin30_0239 [Gammaproteobacteria bacterium]|nr:MAG: hypothetical protein BMS9Abin30_0239 [Gammaproteobacteria bacterium]